MKVRLAAALVAVATVAAACGDSGSSDDAAHDEDVVHVHELLVTNSDDYLLATHLGLYRVTDDGLRLVGENRHDLMSAAMAPDGSFLASGHPDLQTRRLRVDDRPPLLGLVSSETGEVWESVSLLGEADFHGLVVVDGVIYAADSTDETIVVSTDGGTSWETRDGDVQLVAFAVNPSNPDEMIGVDLDDGLVSSIDGGHTWTTDDGPSFTDLEWAVNGQAGLDDAGVVHRRSDLASSWVTVDDIEDIAALGVDGDDMVAITLPNRIYRSTDGGRTWTTN